MKNIAIIPARGGSKRLPNKNCLLLGEIPLLVHSIQYAQANSAIIDQIYVTTDDAEIKNIALQYGAQVIDRPSSISGDFEPTISSLQHALSAIDSDIDNIILLLNLNNPIRRILFFDFKLILVSYISFCLGGRSENSKPFI